jgi:hypothetical protein
MLGCHVIYTKSSIRGGFAQSLLVCSRDRISRDPQRVARVEALVREYAGQFLTVE